jgi:hypothetical protein
MWTLIIITLLLPSTAGSTGASGAGVTTSMLSFADQQKCLAAAEAIGVPDFAQIPAGTAAPVSGIYRMSRDAWRATAARCCGRATASSDQTG